MSDNDEMFEQELIRVEKHLNSQDESIKVEKHPKDSLKSIKAEKRPKDNLRFRERNGAVYQVPNSWEERYEKNEAAKAGLNLTRYDVKECTIKHPLRPKGVLINKRVAEIVSDANKESDKSSDYYISLKKEIRADIEFADYKGYKHTLRKGNSRWKRKHLEEIEKDKREIQSWFESGVVYKAEVPRQTRQDPESDGIDPDAHVEMPKSKSLTLGDYFPTIPVKTTESSSSNVESTESDQLSGDNNDKSEEVLNFASNHYENFEARQACYKERCKSYFDKLGKSYPGCCSSSENEKLPEECSSDKVKEIVKHSINSILSPEEKTQKDKEIPLCIHGEELSSEKIKKVVKHSIDNILNPEKKICRDKEIPLCVHGYNYHVKHLSDSVFTESDLMFEVVPRKYLYDFTEAIRTLIKIIEDLRSLRHSRKFFRCQKDNCLWSNIAAVKASNDNSSEVKKINPFAKPIYDLTSLEARMYQVSNPRYGLTLLLEDKYNSNEGIYTEHVLGENYKKALDSQENLKSKGFEDKMEKFVVSMFALITTMKDFMKIHELRSVTMTLTSGLFDFHGHAWALRRMVINERCTRLQCCGPLFRFRKTKEPTLYPDSGIEINAFEVEKNADLQLSAQPQFNVKTVPEQYCPRFECISPSWNYQPGERINKTQDFDLAERETIKEASFIAPNKQSTSESYDEVERASI